jgi:xanthine dehydrogenase molybdopterin-binding subunit B
MVLGLPDTSLIEVRMTSTALVPEGGGTYGSMASGANAYGMELACKTLKARMQTVERTLQIARSLDESVDTGAVAPAAALPWKELVSAAVKAGVDLSVKSWDHDLSVSGNGYGASVSVIELDVLTVGDWRPCPPLVSLNSSRAHETRIHHRRVFFAAYSPRL